MEVFLLRHGKAEDFASSRRDRDRRLTREGVESLTAELPGIKKRIAKINAILTSPYPRAEQTAQIVATAYGIEDKVEETDALCMASAEKQIVKKLRSFPPDSTIVLVGHAPLLDELIEHLSNPPRLTFLKKGGLAKITFDGLASAHTGKFHWELKPKELKEG